MGRPLMTSLLPSSVSADTMAQRSTTRFCKLPVRDTRCAHSISGLASVGPVARSDDCDHVNLSPEEPAVASFGRAGRRKRPPGLRWTRRSGEHSEGWIQGTVRPGQSAPCRDRRRRGGGQPRQAAVRARARGHHRAGARGSRHHRPSRASRLGRRADRLGRARSRTGVAAGGRHRCGPQIRHAADRAELPGHHDARRQASMRVLPRTCRGREISR